MGTNQIGLSDIQQTKKPRRLRLLAPLRYLNIEAPEKRFYDVTFPIAMGVCAWVGLNFLDPRPSFFGPSGILATAQSFLMMAVPFLIGALASVAMGSPGSYLGRRAPGVEIVLEEDVLTMRQFVCYLLGYLCFLGLAAFIGVTVAMFVEPTVSKALASYPDVATVVRQVGAFIVLLTFAAFIITVFWALYFLTEIVNRHHE